MRLQRGGNATQINQDAQHKLFVEGKDSQEIDPIVIKELLDNNELTAVGVSTMGGCDHVRSAAQALIYEYPCYYFLIDRDEQIQETVDKSWQSFPNPDEYNMLIWHKRELENYFIDPDYLEKSSFLKPEVNIRQHILDECNRWIFLDAANLTLYSISRKLPKFLPMPHFKNRNEFGNQNEGWIKLENLSTSINDIKTSVTTNLKTETINQLYLGFIEELSGGTIPLQYGSGAWLARMSGKQIFRTISNQCFLVLDLEGNIVKGKEQNKAIARELVKLPLQQQPEDFQQLVSLLKSKVGAF